MNNQKLKDLIDDYDQFPKRHIGPNDEQVQTMLRKIGKNSVEDLMKDIIPIDVLDNKSLEFGQYKIPLNGLSEQEYLEELAERMEKNKYRYKNYLGQGYSGTITPSVIKRNVLENPKWYTKYSPYQSELAQGNMEALINYQTMCVEMTGLDVSNASLLDEGQSAAEALMLSYNSHNGQRDTYFVDSRVYKQTLSVIQARATYLKVNLIIADVFNYDFNDEVCKNLCGIYVQSPDNYGQLHDFSKINLVLRKHKVISAIGTDILALTLYKTPGEQHFDIALGNSQRMGVPMGYGGPHAAFFVVADYLKRKMPGKIIGLSKDKQDNERVYRMSLSTREQHIRREKATSNICTSQVLLANIAGMYAIYHGKKGLLQIANRIRSLAQLLDNNLQQLGYQVLTNSYFDTITIKTGENTQQIQDTFLQKYINVRNIDDQYISVSIDETHSSKDIKQLIEIFSELKNQKYTMQTDFEYVQMQHERKSSFMEQQIFNHYNSETNLMRYIDHLAAKDISLTNSMMSLGSCTMKLNSASQLQALSWSSLNIHPFVKYDQVEGYHIMIRELSDYLKCITKFDGFSFQPNSGAAGEYAGLVTIMNYLKSKGQSHRDVCLIPQSAHGTNPASATMCGMKVVVVNSDINGNVDLDDLQNKIVLHSQNLAAFMITYPSTHGVFEKKIKLIIEMVHNAGGQVYMDGANMNAQVGWTSPGYLNADVCHLNLHKTFAIPHGGGGPGMGPIGVKQHLIPYLPNHLITDLNQVESKYSINEGYNVNGYSLSSAAWGSASILSISHAYIKMMGVKGIKDATAIAILNSNYLRVCLQEHYNILYSQQGCAHEFIIDIRPIKNQCTITEEDIAKRLMDYGFHAPTMSFPVVGTLMIEPTESEDIYELNRFIDAMISIRKEIQDVIDKKVHPHNNVLKNAPHSYKIISRDQWDYPYSRQQAAFPLPWLINKKFWPPVGRIDNVYGDKNLKCTCPSIDEYR